VRRLHGRCSVFPPGRQEPVAQPRRQARGRKARPRRQAPRRRARAGRRWRGPCGRRSACLQPRCRRWHSPLHAAPRPRPAPWRRA
jgi:hypothetical protein